MLLSISRSYFKACNFKGMKCFLLSFSAWRMKLSRRGFPQGSSISVIAHIPQHIHMFKHMLILIHTHTPHLSLYGTSAKLYSSPFHLSVSNFPSIDPPLRLCNFPQNRCQASITQIDVFNKNAIRRKEVEEEEEEEERTLFSWRRNLEVGVLLSVCVLLGSPFHKFRLYWCGWRETFFKSAFEESQMLQDETPTCVCVCACVPVSELRLTWLFHFNRIFVGLLVDPISKAQGERLHSKASMVSLAEP